MVDKRGLALEREFKKNLQNTYKNNYRAERRIEKKYEKNNKKYKRLYLEFFIKLPFAALIASFEQKAKLKANKFLYITIYNLLSWLHIKKTALINEYIIYKKLYTVIYILSFY